MPLALEYVLDNNLSRKSYGIQSLFWLCNIYELCPRAWHSQLRDHADDKTHDDYYNLGSESLPRKSIFARFFVLIGEC